MSTDHIPANISATNAHRFNQVMPKCPAEMKLDCSGSSVIVKPVLEAREKHAAFRFLYEIYVEREKLVPPFKLPPKCVASRSKCDKWDLRPSTRHIVAICEGEVVGHVRLLYRKDGKLPLEENGFSISSDPENECEISKLILHPNFRHSDILAAFYWNIFHVCRTEQRLKGVIFSSQPKHESLYARIGAVPIGSFMNTELDKPCTVMRITFVDTYGPQFGGGLLSRRREKYEPAFLPSAETLNLLSSRVNPTDGTPPAWTAYRLEGAECDGEAGVWRLRLGEESAIVKLKRDGGEMPSNKDTADERAAYNFPNLGPMVEGLCTPKVIGTQQGQGMTRVIFEDMWTPQNRRLRYSDVVDLAERLGTWQARTCRVDSKGLASSTIADYLNQGQEGVQDLPTLSKRAPVLAPIVSGEDWDLSVHLWHCRVQFLKSLADAPQAFAHNNLVSRNCIVQQVSDAQTRFVLIDWSQSCIGPVGCDLGPLVFGSSLLFSWTHTEAEGIWSAALDKYTEALLEAPMSFEPWIVMQSAVLTAVLRYIAWAGHYARMILATSGGAFNTGTHGAAQVVERYCEIRASLLKLWKSLNKSSQPSTEHRYLNIQEKQS